MARDLPTVPLSTLAAINPSTDLSGLSADSAVSFIPMSDATEGGDWLQRQERPLAMVRKGYTPFAEGDVLFAKITPCMENGKGAHALALASGVGFGSTEFHVLRAKDGTEPRFLYHWSLSNTLRRKAEAFMTGSAGQQRVAAEFFDHFGVPALPPPEQRRIAEILDTLDTAIRKTEEVIAKLQQMKQGLLHDLLTRGIDENGELRDPVRHPEQFKESEIGPIPRGWDVAELQQFVSDARPIIYGILMPGRGHPGGVPVVKVKDIVDGRIRTDDLLLTSPTIDRQYQRSRLKTGDLLYTIRGTVGRTAFVPPQLDGANITQDTARVGVASGDPRFVRFALDLLPAQRFVNVETIGQAVKGLNIRDLRRVPIPHPPVAEQAALAAVLDSAECKTELLREDTTKLRLLKHGLMHDLLTGRVRVGVGGEGAA